MAVEPSAIGRLRDSDARVRRSTAEALARIRPTTDTILSALLESMHDPDAGVRAAAASALGEIGPLGPKTTEMTSYLMEASNDPCPRVREEAEKALVAVLEAEEALEEDWPAEEPALGAASSLK